MVLKKSNVSNIVYLMICVIGILAFFLVGVYPNMQSMDELEEETIRLTQQVQAQELLYPIYRQLVKGVQHPVPSELTLPEREALSQDDFSKINDLFYKLGLQCNVAFISAVPDAETYLEDNGHLTLHVSFKGDYFNFRQLLLDVCMLPYLETIEHMSIETESSGKIILLKLRLFQR
jgi:Tfp pilus assembly protein PilO